MPPRQDEGENERDEGRAGGDRIGEERDGHIAGGQPLPHDARSNHRGQEQGGPHSFSHNAAAR